VSEPPLPPASPPQPARVPLKRRAILKAAIKERQAGKPAEEIYKTYQGQVRPNFALAFAISSVADPERKRRYAVLNYVLVALLVLVAVLKALSVVMFSNLSPGLMAGGVVLGLIVPLYFAFAIARFDGRAYPFLILLSLFSALNILFEKGNWLGKLSDLVLPAAIIAVAFVAQRKIFPNMRLFRVKKGADGSYVWCNQERRFAEATLRGMPPPVTARQGIPVSNRSRFLVILILIALVLFVGVSIRDAYYNRGAAKIEKGDLDGAIADFNRKIELNPKDARAYYNRGIAKQAKGDLDGAIADFSRAIEFDPKYAIAYNNRGIAKDDKGDLDGAIADYSRAIELDPKHAVAYNNRGIAKEARGDLDGAIADYNRAIELDPKLAIAYNNRGNAEKKLSRSPSTSAEMPSVPLASPASPTMTLAPGVNLRQVSLEAHLQFYKMHSNLLNMTRWMQVQSSVSGYKRITREDLRDFDWKARNVLDSIDQVLGGLPVSDQEPWRVRRALVSARSEQARLFEANWDEWHASGVKPKKGEAKPWQKEAIRLQSEIDAVEKRNKELSQKSQ
jgi:tetratricopeptide (TPR) repeat protein